MSGTIRRLTTVGVIAGIGMAGMATAAADVQAQQQRDVQKRATQQSDFRIRAPGVESQSTGTETRATSTSMKKPSGQVKSQGARSNENVRAVKQALKQEGHDMTVDGERKSVE